jgi:PAS domain S-box-containing protein
MRSTISAVLQVALPYLAFGVIWILVSDRVVNQMEAGGIIDSAASAQTVKGIVYVVLSTALVATLVLVAFRAFALQTHRLQATLEATSAGLLEADLRHGGEYGSPEILSMLGFDPNTIGDLTTFLRGRLHPDDRNALDEALSDVEDRSRVRRLRVLDAHGEWRQLHLQGGIVERDREGKPAVFRAVLLDMTEIRQLEREVRKFRKLESLGALANGVAHDFNNILGSAQGFARLVRRRTTDELTLTHLDGLDRAHRRGRELAAQIQEFGRSGPTRVERVELGKIVEDTLKLLQGSTPDTVRLEGQVDDDCPAVRANASQLQRILMNLALNGVRSMDRSGGVLRIDARPLDTDGYQAAYLRIQDTGLGMDAATLRSAFEPYFSTRGASTGIGLGLAMVNGIVEAFEGQIEVDSRVGEGTTFSITLPAFSNERPSQPEPST